MTPKEKANQLIRLMTVDMKIDFWQTKQCALIAVDEIKKLAIWTEGEIYDYFEEVKKEIEKIGGNNE
jgi:hypothetical protein